MSTPTNTDEFLERLACDVTARLNSLPFFVDITVRDEQLGGVADMIAAAMDGSLKKAGKAGVAVIVHFPDVINDQDEGPAGALMDVQLLIEIYENVPVNRGALGTGKKRGRVAATILKSLKGYVSGYVVMTQPLCTKGRVITAEMAADNELRLMVRLATQWPMTFDQQVATPGASSVIVDGEHSVAMSCDTPGAAIWYTMQGGGYPDPANPLAAEYIESLTVVGADEIRAMAYAPNMLPSEEICVRITPVAGSPMITESGGHMVTEAGGRVTTEPS